MKIRGKAPKLKSLKLSDLELIKTTANGKYKNVFARIYRISSRMVNCKISECKEVKGVFERSKLSINNLVDESFKGSCILKVYRVYVGLSKMIRVSVEEIMATELTIKQSYFDEYEEIESSDESSLEED